MIPFIPERTQASREQEKRIMDIVRKHTWTLPVSVPTEVCKNCSLSGGVERREGWDDDGTEVRVVALRCGLCHMFSFSGPGVEGL